MVLSTVVSTSFARVLTLLSKQDSGFLLEGFIIVVGSRIRGGGDVLPFDLIAQR